MEESGIYEMGNFADDVDIIIKDEKNLQKLINETPKEASESQKKAVETERKVLNENTDRVARNILELRQDQTKIL